MPSHLGLDEKTRRQSVGDLDTILADLSALRALYKHFHWRVAGRRFIMLHELYDKHAGEILEVVDAVAERIQTLGGEATAWPGDIAAKTAVARPTGSSSLPKNQLQQLLEAHRIVLARAHEAARRADEAGDIGTNDLLAGSVIRAGQLQVWFAGEHLDHAESD